MATSSSIRRSSSTRDWPRSCAGWEGCVISCRPINFTMRISGSGRRRFPMRFRGRRRACGKGRAHDAWISTLQETSTPCARRMAPGDRPTPFPWRVLQGVHFLPQGFKDADPYGYDHQHRTGQDFRALANGDQARWDVSSLRANILRDEAAAAVAAAKGEGGDRKGANMAAAANFAQPWPVL